MIKFLRHFFASDVVKAFLCAIFLILVLSLCIIISLKYTRPAKVSDETKVIVLETIPATAVILETPEAEVATTEIITEEPTVVIESDTEFEMATTFEAAPSEKTPEEVSTEISRYTFEDESIMLAKLLYKEAGIVESQTEQANVIWTVLNRVDSTIAYFPDTIQEVITKPNQFAWNPDAPTIDYFGRDLIEFCHRILMFWAYGEDNGIFRTLPEDYYWFKGDGKHNHFTNSYIQFKMWSRTDFEGAYDYSLGYLEEDCTIKKEPEWLPYLATSYSAPAGSVGNRGEELSTRNAIAMWQSDTNYKTYKSMIEPFKTFLTTPGNAEKYGALPYGTRVEIRMWNPQISDYTYFGIFEVLDDSPTTIYNLSEVAVNLTGETTTFKFTYNWTNTDYRGNKTHGGKQVGWIPNWKVEYNNNIKGWLDIANIHIGMAIVEIRIAE